MNSHRQDDMSHLFLVRIRAAGAGEDLQPESKLWRGRVQRVVNGEAYDFCGWDELIERIGAMLAGTQPDNHNQE